MFAVKFKENYIDPPASKDCELSYCFIISIIVLKVEESVTLNVLGNLANGEL